jgi:hypothetical protein
MKYETRVVDAEKGIVQITTEDERFYAKTVEGKVIYIPSVTWITGYFPRGKAFEVWQAGHGYEEAEALKNAAGERGSMVHNAVALLLTGASLQYNTVVGDRELTAEEYLAVMSFVEWFDLYHPTVILSEHTVFSPGNRYAGTLDLYCTIKDKPWIIDFKTSAAIYPSHEIQVSAYKHALGVDARLGILQLGYKYNKTKKWKFTEVEDQIDLFNAVYRIWQKECEGVTPKQRDYPLSLTLNLGGQDAKTTETK